MAGFQSVRHAQELGCDSLGFVLGRVVGTADLDRGMLRRRGSYGLGLRWCFRRLESCAHAMFSPPSTVTAH